MITQVLRYPDLKPIDWMHPPKATTRVSTDLIAGDGVRFTGSFRTVCWWLDLEQKALAKFGQLPHMIQPCYHDGPLSAGTHDYDACIDWRIDGASWTDVQSFGRRLGMGCWWRHTGTWASPSTWHIHGFVLPHGRKFATRVGVYVDGGASTGHAGEYTSQLRDYYLHSFGLKGMHVSGQDHSWFPPDIDATIFNLDRFVTATQEYLMEYKDWSDLSKKQLARDVAAAVKDSVLNADMNALEPDGTPAFKGMDLRNAVKGIYRAVVK